MVTLLFLLAQATVAQEPPPADSPTIVVQGKRICRVMRATGSHARFSRVCQTPEEERAAREQSRDAFNEALEQQRLQRALQCAANPYGIC
jgi:hypothetical protein